MVATFDFDKPKDGCTWSCRHHLVEAGTLGYMIGFGSDAPEKIVGIRDRMVQSFEVLRRHYNPSPVAMPAFGLGAAAVVGC
jgi:hypothetical protein